MTPTTLAAAILRDVPRYGTDPDDCDGFIPTPDGAWLDRDEVLAAITAAMDPAIAERAGEVVKALRACANGIGSFKTQKGDFGLCDDAADLITALLTANAALRAERDVSNELGRAFEEDAGQQRERAEAAEAERDALRAKVARMEGAADRVRAASAIEHARASQFAAEAKVARLEGALRWAHDTLWEINPNNYDHDEVCKLNDASVEVILGIAPLIGETHGKSPEWWAERAALTDGGSKYERKVAQMKKDFPNGI